LEQLPRIKIYIHDVSIYLFIGTMGNHMSLKSR